MARLLRLAPLFAASALAAQVPAAPPRPIRPVPAPAPAPIAPVPSTWTIAPDLSDLSNRLDYSVNYNLDYNLDYELSSAMAGARDALNTSRLTLDAMRDQLGGLSGFSFGGGPVAWDRQDPADSLYRNARDQLNRGDYRKAADLFKSLPQKYPTSVYVADAQYWQAFSLYRIGGTPELQEALAVLEARKPADQEPGRPASNQSGRSTTNTNDVVRTPGLGGVANDVSTGVSIGFGTSYGVGYRRAGVDAAGLAARIASVLSQRGMASDPAVKRALSAGGNTCDQEDQSVRAEALNALMQNDPETGRQMATKILANHDDCSVPLRRNAVMLVASRHDDAAVSTLIPVAKSDPSPGVRMVAIEYLSRSTSEAAVDAVISLSRSDTSAEVKRIALRALSQSTSPRARAEVRAIVENNSADESLRLSAIDGFDGDRISGDDAAWLRGLYPRVSSARVKERIVSAVARAGGDANNQWLLALVRNEDEPLDSRTAALSRAGRTLDVVTLGKIYDTSPQRPIRETVVDLLSSRAEPEALDKIVDIARNGTDPDMRRRAIAGLARSKDPRASKLLLQLVDHQ